MKNIVSILIGLSLLPFVRAIGQESADIELDSAIISKIFSSTQMEKDENAGALLVRVALSLLDTPYVGATLEVGDEERLIINLREFDCTTFMETCVAITRAIQMHTPTFEAYCKELERIRYRNGVVSGYTSRLHYTTEWIADNEAKGVVEDVTKEIGGIAFMVKINYMSTHADKYKQLKGRLERIARIKQIEDKVSKRGGYYYIPKEDIPDLSGLILNGDIICFTTSIAGLDVSHIGIAYWQKNKLTFIHASSSAKKVIINPESLNNYCAGINSNTGIIVVKLR